MKAVRRVRKKTAYHHGDLRRALIDAALLQVEKHGPGGVTLREMARMVGVSHQAPYRHFADRSELLAAVAEEGFLALHAEMVEKMQAAPDAHEALHVCGITYVLFAVAHSSHFRVMFGAEAAACRQRTPSLAAAVDGVAGLLTQAIDEAKQPTAAAENDTMDVALAAWSLVHGLASLLVEGQLHRRIYTDRSPLDLAERVLHSYGKIKGDPGGPRPPKRKSSARG